VFDAATNIDAAVKIRTLLSRMFEKAWQAGVNGHTDDENTVLKHIITWPSFHRFLGLFCMFDLLYFIMLQTSSVICCEVDFCNSVYYSLPNS